ncbi:MAG: hypothetical protein KF773_33095 [Deltaproteobacteria bacterium]|nr:hypothetical protein [Deltaproteobacteria bacterium]MCW5805199.1 hypothetical protein [Deltaproteobacteria bacterium]
MNKLFLSIPLVLALVACGKGDGKSGGDGIGIPECDAYIQKTEACAAKVGGQMGESLKRGAKMFGDVWKDNAKDASMKDQLPKTCSDATAAAKKQFAQCDW